jgi:hypothetical protein
VLVGGDDRAWQRVTWLSAATLSGLRYNAARADVLRSLLDAERDAHACTRVTLAKAAAQAAALDDRLAASRIYIASIERDLASKAAGAWRWRMSTTEGGAGAAND